MSLPTSSIAWPDILDAIRSRVSRQQFATWFQNLQPLTLTGEEIGIRVPHRFFKEWLAHNYMNVISDAVYSASGLRPQVRFVIDESVKPRPPAIVGESEPPIPFEPFAHMRGMRLNDHYTFSSFVVGPSNQLAHAAARAVTSSPGTTYNPLFMHGAVGLGKSHLLQAICHAVLDGNPSLRIAYLSCETFVNEFISAIQKNEFSSFRHRYRQLDLLLIDDIQFLSRAERSQEEFFHTFNDLYNAQKQIVLSSDQSPEEIAGLQGRLTSRFKSGLVARVDPPSYEMRIAILKKKAELRGVFVPDDVVNFIAERITTNIRELDGAITKVVGHASLLGLAINLDSARLALNEPLRAAAAITIDDIVKATTAEFNVKLSDLQSRKRTRSIVLPRQVCMYLARSLTLLSLEEIGGYFGGRDHSTVLHAEEKIRSEIERNERFRNSMERLDHALKNGQGASSLKASG